MYRVLVGKEDIGEFIRQVVLSVEQNMYGEAISALTTGLAAVTSGTDLTETGAFDMKTLIKMGELVQVRNAGVRPIITGSATALMNVIPDGSSGFRGNYDANGGAINLTKNVFGFDVLRLDQALAADGGLVT